MPEVSDVIEVNVRASSPGLSRSSFGIPLILGAAAGWLTGSQGDRIRSYSSLTAVAADFSTSTAEYLMAKAAFAQNPRPATVMIGLRQYKPTEVRTLTIDAVEGATYRITVDGTAYSYVARSGDTAADIAAALVADGWAVNSPYIDTHGKGRFVTKGGKVYRCSTGGSSWNGPTATSGTQADGATLVWTHISALGTPGAYQASHTYGANALIAASGNVWICPAGGDTDSTAPTFPASPALGDSYTDHAGLVWYAVKAWASGQAYTSTGNHYVSAASGHVYHCTTSGSSYAGPTGTATTPQVEPGGTVAWVYVSTGPTLATDGSVTAAIDGDDDGVLHLTSKNAGQFVSFQLNDFTLMELFCDNDHVNVAADLDALLLASKSWWMVLSPFGCATDLLDIASWAEANKRFFLACSQDSAIATQAAPGSPPEDTTPAPDLNVAYVHSLRSYNFSAIAFHHDNAQFMAAAWAGNTLPLPAGSETWKFRTLAGVTPTPLTDAQLANVRGTKQDDGTFAGGNRANCYVQVTAGDSGISITLEGTVSGSNKFIDTTRGLASMSADIQTAAFNTVYQASQSDGKMPFTDDGISKVVGSVTTVLKDYAKKTRQFLQSTPPPAAFAPTLDQILASNPTAFSGRSLPDVEFSAVGAGAIHGVKIAGTVSF